MRTIVHLSDVHFGHADETIVAAVIDIVRRLAPDLVAISGDLTQRARPWQFERAREFLDALPRPQVIVPGNHDVPLYNLPLRFFSPLRRYAQQITPNLQPVHFDPEIAVVGINTTRSFTIKGGKIRLRDLRHASEALERAGDGVVKIVVAHHPFGDPDNLKSVSSKTGAIRALESLAQVGVDVFLTGHLHVSYTGHTASRYQIAGRTAIVVEAGTATSTRTRREANAFNVLRVAREQIDVERWVWNPGQSAFQMTDGQTFTHTATGWTGRV